MTTAVDKTLAVNTQWFHVFKSMIDSGDLANISGSALKVYLVIKSHANFNTGASFPSEHTLSVKSGLSISQVKRNLVELRQLSYLLTEKVGRKNHYVLREKIVLRDLFDNNVAEASWDYIPNKVTDIVDDIKNYVHSAQQIDAKVIHIEHLQININQVNGNGVVINNQSKGMVDLSKFDQNMQHFIRKFAEKSGVSIKENATSNTNIEPDRGHP